MSKLVAQVINEKIVGIELPTWSLVTQPFKIIRDNQVMPLGYTDISSIVNWDTYGFTLDRDFSYVRHEIQEIVEDLAIDSCLGAISDPPLTPMNGDKYYIIPTATGAWTGYEGSIATWSTSQMAWIKEPTDFVGYRLLSNEEKLICAQLKIGGQADHFADYGVPSIVDYGVEYHRKSIECRKERMLRATVEVYNRLPLNAYEMLSDLTTSPLGDMIGRYERYGVKGTLEDYHVDFNPNPTPGICDYLTGRAPFSYVEPYISAGFPTGLALKNWNPIDAATLSDFVTEIYNILVYGNSLGT